jgi:hypothetical protein
LKLQEKNKNELSAFVGSFGIKINCQAKITPSKCLPFDIFLFSPFFFLSLAFHFLVEPKNTKGNEENQQNEMNITQKNGVRVTTLNRVC